MQILRSICLILIISVIGFGCDNINNLTPDQLTNKGRQLYEQGKFDDAVKLFKRAIQLKPTSAEIHFELGVMYYQEWKRSLDQAQKKILEETIVDGKKYDGADNEKLLLRKGYRKELLGFAMDEFDAVLKYDPSNWKARYHIAVNFLNNKKYDKAIVEFKKVIEIEPKDSNSYSLLGKAYMEAGQYQLAIKPLEKAVGMDPGVENYYFLGMAYKNLNNWKKVGEISQKLKERDTMRYSMLIDPLNVSPGNL